MSERNLPADKARKLKPGDNHYRAYVGPPKRYSFMSLSQIGILFAAGLKETDTVLDFGCGSLRVGRMLIPFLHEGGYFGIDPNQWLIEDSIKHELGQDSIALKKPRFLHNDDFDCGVFNEKFDFILAQSIVTHSGSKISETLFKSAAGALKGDGIFLLNYKQGSENTPLPEEGWTYPQVVPYAPSTMLDFLHAAGFHAIETPWFHPGVKWVAATLSPDRLPSEEELKSWIGKPVQRSLVD